MPERRFRRLFRDRDHEAVETLEQVLDAALRVAAAFAHRLVEIDQHRETTQCRFPGQHRKDSSPCLAVLRQEPRFQLGEAEAECLRDRPGGRAPAAALRPDQERRRSWAVGDRLRQRREHGPDGVGTRTRASLRSEMAGPPRPDRSRPEDTAQPAPRWQGAPETRTTHHASRSGRIAVRASTGDSRAWANPAASMPPGANNATAMRGVAPENAPKPAQPRAPP